MAGVREGEKDRTGGLFVAVAQLRQETACLHLLEFRISVQVAISEITRKREQLSATGPQEPPLPISK